MKRAREVHEATEKIGKNKIKVRMVADCCKKVAAANVELERGKSATTDRLGNTWNVRKIRIITIENESGSEEDESTPEIEEMVTLPSIAAQSSNLVDALASHSVMDSHCHIDFILDRRLPKLNLCTWTRLVQRYPALHHPALKGFIQNFCDPAKWPEQGTAPPSLLASAWLEPDMSICYTIGCHPHFAPLMLKAGALELLERLLLEGKGRGCAAVGECGMDRSAGCRVQKEVQSQAFRLQVELAMKLQLPLVLHIREAEEAGLAVLKEVGLPRDWPIHRHCWNDSWELAEQWLSEFPGSVLGFTNLVSNSNWMGVQAREVVRRMPLSRLILETDAPYFRPRSLEGLMEARGQPQFCTPIHLIAAAKTVAEVKRMTVEEVLAQSDANISSVYKLKRRATRGEGHAMATEIFDGILGDITGEMNPDAAGEINEISFREELNTRMMCLEVACEVMVSAVESPDKIYLQLAGSRLVQLNRMNSNLTDFFAEVDNRKCCAVSVENVKAGLMVAAQFGEDTGFFRARVVTVDDNWVELLFVDFGDWDCKPLSSVFRLPGQFLGLPHQAVPCCLAGLSAPGSVWSEESIDCLMELTQAASGQVLWVKLVDWRFEDGLGLVPCVELFFGNCSINNSFVQTGHANFG